MDLPTRDRTDDRTFLNDVAALVPSIRTHAAGLDHDGAFPTRDVETLAGAGVLTAALPPSFGGLGFGTTPDGALPLASLLGLIGSASLPLGRIIEGHVNALALVFRYASPVQQARAAVDVRAGALFGVWNTDDRADPLTVADGYLSGRKILCSGAGHVTRALVPGLHPEGRRMLLVALDDPARADLSPWTAQGMRASATGHVDFAGIPFTTDMLIGHPGDYERQPVFSGGAWRVLAVFAGGLDALADALSTHLAETGRDTDAHQLARAGQVFIARETARLWVREAARRVEAAPPRPRRDRRLRQSGPRRRRNRRRRFHHPRPALRRTGRLPPSPSDRASLPRPRHLSAPARARSRPDRRRRPFPAGMKAGDALAAIRALPVKEPGEILAPGPLLILAPHPDDESLGTGGLIARETRAGRPVHVALLTDGAGSHQSALYPPPRLAALRDREILDALDCLGLAPTALHRLGYPDRDAPREGPALEKAADRLRDLLALTGAATLVTTWIADPHADHLAAALTARRAVAGTAIRLLQVPIWGFTHPPDADLDIPPPTGARLDVSAFLDRKRTAIAAHRSQTTHLIHDDPAGFCLDPGFVDLFTGPCETLLDG